MGSIRSIEVNLGGGPGWVWEGCGAIHGPQRISTARFNFCARAWCALRLDHTEGAAGSKKGGGRRKSQTCPTSNDHSCFVVVCLLCKLCRAPFYRLALRPTHNPPTQPPIAQYGPAHTLSLIEEPPPRAGPPIEGRGRKRRKSHSARVYAQRKANEEEETPRRRGRAGRQAGRRKG